MTRSYDRSDERFDYLLREQVNESAHEDIAGLVRDVRRVYAAPLPLQVQNRHVADMIAAGREASAEDRPSPLRHRIDGLRFRFSRRFIAGSLVGKVLLAASVATAATTGMAATGHLPAAVQDRFSEVAVSAEAPPSGSRDAPAGEDASPPDPSPPRRPAPQAVPAPEPSRTPDDSRHPSRHSAADPAPSDTACDQNVLTVLAQTPEPGEDIGAILDRVARATQKNLAIDDLLACLVPPAGGPAGDAAGGAGDGSVGSLLEGLLGPGG